MVYGGVKDVLVTNEIVGRQKLRRLMGLAAHAPASASAPTTRRKSRACEAARRGRASTLPGPCRDQHGRQPLRRRTGRAGARPRAPDRWTQPHLSFAGLQAYHGSAQHLRAWEERQKAIAGAVEKAGATRDLLAGQRHRLRPTSPAPAPARSSSRRRAASIPSCNAARTSSWTPITAATSTATARPTRAFEPSLFVWATVMSRPTAERAIVDAGLKALSFDSGPPTVWDEPAAIYERASDEHGRLGIIAGHQPAESRRQVGWSPAIATRPSTSTTGMSACAATGSKRSGRSPRGGRFIRQGRRRCPPSSTRISIC